MAAREPEMTAFSASILISENKAMHITALDGLRSLKQRSLEALCKVGSLSIGKRLTEVRRARCFRSRRQAPKRYCAFQGGSDRAGPLGLIDVGGTLYGATNAGGGPGCYGGGCGTVFSVKP